MECVGALTAAILWGVTNPLIRRASFYREDTAAPYRLIWPVWQLWRTIGYLPFLVPFVLNQTGSLLFMWTLTKLPVTFAVPFVNSLTFLFTELTGRVLGEKNLCPGVIFGAIFIVIGIIITLLAD
uniref:Transmembrane protein 234 n=1 Tax=Setaria digitata TaxID=48799 RepID=A0A915Q028_9BILA